MPQTSPIVVEAKAQPAWQTLSADERQVLTDRLTYLGALSADRWPREVKRLKSSAPVYVLRATCDQLVLFRQECTGQIVVLDFLANDLGTDA